MLELKNNKHNTYCHCTYLYIVNAVIFKLLLTSYLKRDLAKKQNNNNVTTLICLAISVACVQSFCTILLFNIVGSESGSNWYGNIDTILNNTGADRTCCFGKGRGSTETPSKLFTNHNALGQLTNHNTVRFSEGGPSSNPELFEPFVLGWGERYCNNVNYVKNNAFFEPPCSSTPPKQNQDFVKEHNRTSLTFPLKGSFLPPRSDFWVHFFNRKGQLL